MTDRKITKYVAGWFVRADEDLGVAQFIIEENRPYNPACFHEQQAAEKYLKGFLAHHEKHARKIHDLEVLLQECIKIDQSFGTLLDNAQYLNRFYIESRYPDDYVEFTREDAERGFEFAIRIKEFILEKIKSTQKSGFSITGIIIIVAAIAVLGAVFFVPVSCDRVSSDAVRCISYGERFIDTAQQSCAELHCRSVSTRRDPFYLQIYPFDKLRTS